MRLTLWLMLALAVAALCGAGALAAEEPKVAKEDWDWAAAMTQVARKGKATTKPGVVLTLGDSLSYANPSTAWARQGQGLAAEDRAVLKWSHAFEDQSESNGWWLAAVDRPGGRSETASSGVRTDQYLKGGHHGLGALKDILEKYRPQAAFVLLGANDASAGRQPEDVARDMAAILDAIIAAGAVPVLQTCAPRADDAADRRTREYNRLYLGLARERKLPVIDLYGEFMGRAPGGAWKTQLLAADGIHFSPQPAAGPPTEKNLAKCGYLLRCWLAVQKLKEVKKGVFDKL
jgi:lysophospholipase L1-like esterase